MCTSSKKCIDYKAPSGAFGKISIKECVEMKRSKKIVALAMAALMTAGSGMTVFAGQWQWLDQNQDGISECYYYDDNGTMLTNTTTPDGYTVDSNGAWVVNGVVQTQTSGTASNTVNHNAGYDPAHPLAGKIDEWNLRLPRTTITGFDVYSNNVQAMLTGQMDQYYASPVGYSTDSMGNSIYTTQEAYDRARANEQTMYNWFCDWLNGMDFENMSEMERAKEIQKVLASAEYEYGDGIRDAYQSILINKKGYCGEFAMTAMGSAKALGLKSAVNGTGDHAVYYIQVDGVAYFGQNNELNLAVPTPDNVYFN